MNPPDGYAAVTMPWVVTVLPTSGLVAPLPWISSIVAGIGSPGGSSPPMHWVELHGEGTAALKSALLLSVSLPAVRLRDRAAVWPVAAAPSNVLEVP